MEKHHCCQQLKTYQPSLKFVKSVVMKNILLNDNIKDIEVENVILYQNIGASDEVINRLKEFNPPLYFDYGNIIN